MPAREPWAPFRQDRGRGRGPREDARPAAGRRPSGMPTSGAVQDLVVGAVARGRRSRRPSPSCSRRASAVASPGPPVGTASVSAGGATARRGGSSVTPLAQGLTIREAVSSRAGGSRSRAPVDHHPPRSDWRRVRVGVLPRPGVGPVGGREDEEHGRLFVEVGAEGAALGGVADQVAPLLLVRRRELRKAVRSGLLEEAPLTRRRRLRRRAGRRRRGGGPSRAAAPARAAPRPRDAVQAGVERTAAPSRLTTTKRLLRLGEPE